MSAESPHKYIITRAQYLDGICVDMGGREAEQMFLDGLSLGSGHDLMMATNKARALVEAYGMGDEETGVCNYWVERGNGQGRWWERYPQLSETQKTSLDRRVKGIIEEQRQRAITILKENRAIVETIRDLLLEKKVIEAKTLSQHLKEAHPKAAKKVPEKAASAVLEGEVAPSWPRSGRMMVGRRFNAGAGKCVVGFASRSDA